VTIRKTLVEQVWKSSREIVNTPNFWRILDRVTHDVYPETRQGIMIPVRSSIRDSKPPNLASNHTLSLDPRMFGENKPSKAKMTPVTKLFS